ncbi:MAG: universal stress protein [bacterium]
MTKTRILIAIDEPEWAKTIVQTAYNFIDRKNSEVTLLNVIETNIAEEGYFYSKPEKFIEHEAEKSNFSVFENLFENSEVDYKGFLYKEGHPAETIIKLTEKGGYDLLVIGSHNKNAIERLLLGSVAYKATRFAKSSVLVVDSKCHIETENTANFSVLMGIETSDDSFYAAENLWKFIDKERANITLLNVLVEPSLIIPPDAYIYIDMDKIMKESVLVSENLLKLTSNKLEAHGVKVVKKYTIFGDAASIIIDEAEKNNFNLIVVGSHSGSKLSRWFLGSISTKVYEHAKQPVLIIKQH